MQNSNQSFSRSERIFCCFCCCCWFGRWTLFTFVCQYTCNDNPKSFLCRSSFSWKKKKINWPPRYFWSLVGRNIPFKPNKFHYTTTVLYSVTTACDWWGKRSQITTFHLLELGEIQSSQFQQVWNLVLKTRWKKKKCYWTLNKAQKSQMNYIMQNKTKNTMQIFALSLTRQVETVYHR